MLSIKGKRLLEECVSRPPASHLIRDRAARVIAHLHGGKPAILVGWGHAHGGVHGRRRGSRAVGAAGGAGVVLGAAPAQTHAGVADGVALHLVDSHLSGVALHELDETTTLSGGDLDVGDFSEALEERTELILGNVAGQTTDEDGGVVGVCKLIHRLGSTVEGHGRATHGRVHASGTGHTHGGTAVTTDTRTLVLGGSGGDTHGAVATVDTLHLGKSTLLVVLIGEANEAVTAGHAADRVGHDLGRLARGEAALEEGDEDVFVHLGAEVANEDRVLGATVITAGTGQFFRAGRQPTKEIIAYLRSARPPPVAQLSLKTRLVLGMGVPFRERALAAAAGEAKSTKQYPALLLLPTLETILG